MKALGYRPHITFAIYDDHNLKKADLYVLHDVFESVFKQLQKTNILFDELRIFESEESLVIWAKPVVPKEIERIHQQIHEQLDVNLCREHYQPTNWVPHCSLATAVPLERKAEAMKLVQRKIEPFEVLFDVADLVSFHPVKIERETLLADADSESLKR